MKTKMEAQKLLNLIEQAKQADTKWTEEDPQWEVFGAHVHEYKLSQPASEEDLAAFEQEAGVTLPEDYRWFLGFVGNGGAGPYYGLYDLKTVQRETGDYPHPERECRLWPDMTEEDWTALCQELGDDSSDVWDGLLSIGTQGCSYNMMLVTSGPHRGRIVYTDFDRIRPPFFLREQDFLSWYKRWLKEIILGYQIDEFGYRLDGDEETLMAAYEQSHTKTDKRNVIVSMQKFREISGQTKDFLVKKAHSEPDGQVAGWIVQLLKKHGENLADERMIKLWQQGEYSPVLDTVSRVGGYDNWYEGVSRILSGLRGKDLEHALYILSGCKQAQAIQLKELLLNPDLDRDEHIQVVYTSGRLPGKEKLLDVYMQMLLEEPDGYILVYILQAVRGIKDERLLPVYQELLTRCKAMPDSKKAFKETMQRVGVSRIQPLGYLISNLRHHLADYGLDIEKVWRNGW